MNIEALDVLPGWKRGVKRLSQIEQVERQKRVQHIEEMNKQRANVDFYHEQ